jgi:prepilin-type N-terminal cleavage/methylation domain-containing protein
MKSHRGFSLMEVLVVIGIIATAAALLGIGLRRQDSTVALEAAQQMVASLLVEAETKAQLTLRRTALVVDAARTSPEFLRRIRIAVESPADSDHWICLDDGALLPAGIYVVSASVSGVELGSAGSVWPAVGDSAARVANPGSISDGSTVDRSYLIATTPFRADDSLVTLSEDRWVVGVGRKIVDGVRFENPAAVRRITSGAYGGVRFVDDVAF